MTSRSSSPRHLNIRSSGRPEIWTRGSGHTDMNQNISPWSHWRRSVSTTLGLDKNVYKGRSMMSKSAILYIKRRRCAASSVGCRRISTSHCRSSVSVSADRLSHGDCLVELAELTWMGRWHFFPMLYRLMNICSGENACGQAQRYTDKYLQSLNNLGKAR
jgi:hypothetical protein